MAAQLDVVTEATLTDIQRELLRTIWYLAMLPPSTGVRGWPTWNTVQRELYRLHPDLDDARTVVDSLPRVPKPTIGSEQYSLVWASDQILQSTTTIGLSIPGMRAVANPTYADAMARVFKYLADFSNGPNPPENVPLADLALELRQATRDLPQPLSDALIAHTLQREYAVPVTCYELNGVWQCRLDLERQRRYRDVTNAADYFAVLNRIPIPSDPRVQAVAGDDMTTAKIFLVHGRDEAARDSVDLFVRNTARVEPIVLANQPNSGLTLIEKFEREAASADYAIVLMTADDEGALAGDAAQHRARQNVIFELGYFFGKLGRGRVAVLASPDVEHPSDIKGLVYIGFGPGTDWKEVLRRELNSAGFTTV